MLLYLARYGNEGRKNCVNALKIWFIFKEGPHKKKRDSNVLQRNQNLAITMNKVPEKQSERIPLVDY